VSHKPRLFTRCCLVESRSPGGRKVLDTCSEACRLRPGRTIDPPGAIDSTVIPPWTAPNPVAWGDFAPSHPGKPRKKKKGPSRTSGKRNPPTSRWTGHKKDRGQKRTGVSYKCIKRSTKAGEEPGTIRQSETQDKKKSKEYVAAARA